MMNMNKIIKQIFKIFDLEPDQNSAHQKSSITPFQCQKHLQKKQNYLLSEIIDQQYDPEEFQQYMTNQKGLNLQDYTMSQLIKIVQQFKGVIIEPQQSVNQSINKQSENRGLLTEQNTSQLPQSPPTYTETSNQATLSSQQPLGDKHNLNRPQKPIQLSTSSQNKKDVLDANKLSQKQKGKKFQINLKQMIIPQYKFQNIKGKQQPLPSKQHTQKINFNTSKIEKKDFLTDNKQKQLLEQQTSKMKQQQLLKTKQQQPPKQHKPATRSFYQQDEEQNQTYQNDAFIGTSEGQKQKQFFRQSKNSSRQQSVSQSIYIASQNNKQPFIISKKATISSLYKEIKSSIQIDKNGRQKINFFEGFSIKIKSFSKKQSSSIFKFPYITYHVETTFAKRNETNSKGIKDQSNIKSRTWKVQRRFNDFKWLHDFMQKSYHGTPIPPIPVKTKMRSFDDEHLEERMVIFQSFLNKCIHIDEIASDPMLQAFLSIEAREQLQAVKNKFDDKIKNRDQNHMQFLKGQQVLIYGQGMSTISQQSRIFLSRSSQLLQSLNIQVKSLQRNIKQASQNAVAASNILRQLSQLHKANHEHQIKGGAVFDLMSEYIGQLGSKLDKQAYYLKNYVGDAWIYEEMYAKGLLGKIISIDRHKHVLETKFKDFEQLNNLQLGQSFTTENQAPTTTLNMKNKEIYKKTRQLYDINLSLTLQEISRHLEKDLLIISKDFSSGITKYVDQIKDEMMTGVDLITKAMTVTEGKQLKEVELISNKKTNPPHNLRMNFQEE